MESLNCEICDKPTFICTCDKSWEDFKRLKGLGKREKEIFYTDLSISTITVNFNFNQAIDITHFHKNAPKGVEIKYNPCAKKSKVKKKKGTDFFYNSFEIKMSVVDQGFVSCVSVFLFDNGKVKLAGAKTIKTINITIDEIIALLKFIPESLEDPENLFTENIRISMVCSDFKIKPIKEDSIGWCLKQEELKNILVHEHSVSATFNSSKYSEQGINESMSEVLDIDRELE